MNQKQETISTSGCLIKNMQHSGVTEHFVTVLAKPDESPATMFKRLDDCLLDLGSPCILRMDIAGRINTMGTESLQQRYCYNCKECSLDQTREGNEESCPVGGVYVHAVTGGTIRPIWLGGQLMGNVFVDRYVRYVSLDNLHPEAWLSPSEQTLQVFERMEDAVKRAGMTFDNVVRTWLYLDKILDWYDDFNQARDTFFKSRRVYKGLIPTSTGIGGANREGTAIQTSLLAAEPLSNRVTIQAIPSPLQCPALDYGSSFSRAVEIATPDVKRVYVAGTASIDQSGPTLHVGDVEAQIAYTMEVVHAILTSRGLDWEDMTRGVAFLKYRSDFDQFHAYCQANKLPELPVPVSQNDVCRDDLLFELEMDAVKVLTR